MHLISNQVALLDFLTEHQINQTILIRDFHMCFLFMLLLLICGNFWFSLKINVRRNECVYEPKFNLYVQNIYGTRTNVECTEIKHRK